VVNIIPSINSYSKATQRTDCSASTSCTYAEEMTNFANWWTYYRTRLQTMKTSTSLAFANIDDKYRVGFNVINNNSLAEDSHSQPITEPNKFLNIRAFDATQKGAFYRRLFNAHPALNQSWQDDTYEDKFHFTPLRAALSHAGRYFANKLDAQTVDPVEYACQANFSILSTDGSWNKESDFTKKQLAGDHVEFGSFGAFRLDGQPIGNQDNGVNVPLPKREVAIFDESLADVAMYYAETDIRTGCTEENGGVCGSTANQLKQTMTTFTVGLGINGTLLFSDDYKSATSGDFYALTQDDTTGWPTGCPSDYCPERVDDLWHAAVNGNGTYFSAQDPQQLQESLTTALAEIYALSNSGGAAAISTLKPVAGNNSAYVSSYTSMKWTGNLESRDINPVDGVTSKTATWCVEDVAQGACAPPNQISTRDINNTKRTYCAPTGTSVFTAAMDITACTGKLQSQVTRNSDTRHIYTAKAGHLVEFNYTYINNLVGNSLSQWNALDSSQRANMAEKLVGYVRGHSAYEDRGSNLASNRLFRYREKTLGDITDSTAVYVGAPNFNYLESSYGLFKTAQSGRKKSVYVGANDGMLHAFNADDGTERWAYIPSMVLPNLWKLADKNYAHNHQNYVNGPTTVTDICSESCLAAEDWKTVLVGGLGQGGRGFYALDVSNDLPRLLWEFNTTDPTDLGYSFGNPVITKMRDKDSQGGFKWVVLLSSGYNNTSGKGHLYVLDAISGSLIRKISTHIGSADAQSGLAKISAFVARPSENNQADYAYGGDLLGNLWRFKIDSDGSTSNPKNPLLLATLKDELGVIQPITAKPELGKLSGKTVVFIGTGKYLEQADLSNKSSQTLYAIKDDDVGNIERNNLASRSMTTSSDTRTGTKSDNVFDNNAKKGWYIDLPKDSGERQVVASKLASGTLVVPTMVPSSETCSPGGYGWINYIDARNGGAVMLNSTGTVLLGTKSNSIPVGINLFYISGRPKISFTGASNATPQLDPNGRFNGGSKFSGKRASWREWIR
jgi:type IV pilus assembly protein PilY1